MRGSVGPRSGEAWDEDCPRPDPLPPVPLPVPCPTHTTHFQLPNTHYHYRSSNTQYTRPSSHYRLPTTRGADCRKIEHTLDDRSPPTVVGWGAAHHGGRPSTQDHFEFRFCLLLSTNIEEPFSMDLERLALIYRYFFSCRRTHLFSQVLRILCQFCLKGTGLAETG